MRGDGTSCPGRQKWVEELAHPHTLPQALIDLGVREDAIRVCVQAVDPEGKPVAGVPIRRLLKRGDERVWAVAHLTDQRGLAEFHVPADEEHSFRAAAPDFPSSGGSNRRFQKVIKVRIGDTQPEKPIQIRLTAEQVSILFDRDAVTEPR